MILVFELLTLSIFLTINCYILYSDIFYKKIPNKTILYLLSLLPLYIYFFSTDISWTYILGPLIVLIVSFILYSFQFWSAGDSKYFFILSLYIGVTSNLYALIGNIAIITLVYILLHTLYVFIGRFFINPQEGKKFYNDIYTDLKGKFHVTFLSGEGSSKVRIFLQNFFPFFLGFFLFFLLMRLSRVFFISWLGENTGGNSRRQFIEHIIQNYEGLLIIGSIGVIFVFILLIRKIITTIKNTVSNKLGITQKKGSIGMYLLGYSLIGVFLIYQYTLSPEFIRGSLSIIFTLYLALFICIKILIYCYYVTFQIGEADYKPYPKLQVGDIIDKNYLIQLFGTQKILSGKDESINPIDTIQNIDSPLTPESLKKLQYIYKKVNNYHTKNDTAGFEKIMAVKTLKTFAFGPYLFAGFLLSYFYGNSIITSIIEMIFSRLFAL